MKEGRVCLMGLRRHEGTSANHAPRLWSLTDNLSSGLAFEKCSAKRLDLLSLVRRPAAIQMGCCISWSVRYVESERNPSDRDCRAFEPRQPQSSRPPKRPPELRPPAAGRPERIPSTGRGCHGVEDQRGRAAERPPFWRDAPRSSSRSAVCAESSKSIPPAPAFVEIFWGRPALTEAMIEAGLRCACPLRGPCSHSVRRSWPDRGPAQVDGAQTAVVRSPRCRPHRATLCRSWTTTKS